MSCQEGSWCDFLLWLMCFSATMGIIATFSIGCYITIDWINNKFKR